MAKNEDMRRAKAEKNDEWYTQLPDIENELKHYKEFFENKVVLCNCDDPFESNFFKYFALNFNKLKIKKLICTCYDSSPIVGEQLSLFELNYQIPNKNKKAYKLIITEVRDLDGNGAVDLTDVKELIKNNKNTLTQLKEDGDFRSNECIKLLKESDIIVTNPPFSLFREFIGTILKYNKKFIIMGKTGAIGSKDIFPYLMNNKMWVGYNFNVSVVYKTPYPNKLESNRKFVIGKGYNPDDGYIKVPEICWYTNLDIKKKHEKMILFKKYNPEKYPSYFNYDGIDVSELNDIPEDYYGHIGVPITFMDVYNPDQFRIIGLGTYVPKKYVHKVTENKKTIEYINENTGESVWKFPYTVTERKIGNSLRISKDGKPDKTPFSRIIIQLID